MTTYLNFNPENVKRDLAIFESDVLSMLRNCLDKASLSGLSESKKGKKYLIRFSAPVDDSALGKVTADFYSDDVKALKKLAAEVQRKYTPREIATKNMSISFKSASGKKTYGTLHAFCCNSGWIAFNGYCGSRGNAFTFDFSEGKRR